MYFQVDETRDVAFRQTNEFHLVPQTSLFARRVSSSCSFSFLPYVACVFRFPSRAARTLGQKDKVRSHTRLLYTFLLIFCCLSAQHRQQRGLEPVARVRTWYLAREAIIGSQMHSGAVPSPLPINISYEAGSKGSWMKMHRRVELQGILYLPGSFLDGCV